MIHNQNRNSISDPYALEDQLARELLKRKRRREIERIYAESEEIKLLKQKISTAYVTKERTQQLAQQQLRRVQKQESEIEAAILEKLKRELEKERDKEKYRLKLKIRRKICINLIPYKLQTLQKQMKDHEQQREEAKEQYFYEKDQVNRVINQFIQEDRIFLEDSAKKKKIAFSDMQVALREKAEHIQSIKQRERDENQKYLNFIKEKDRQALEIKVKKQKQRNKKKIQLSIDFDIVQRQNLLKIEGRRGEDFNFIQNNMMLNKDKRILMKQINENFRKEKCNKPNRKLE